MNNIVPVSDVEKMANAIAKSGFFGMKTPEQAMALMLIAQAEGKHPASAAQEYHVIQGKPALKADAMLARFQAAGGKVEWLVLTDKEVTGKFSHAAGGTVEIKWTYEMATAAKLTGKDTWKQYPRQMLRARVISEGIRTVYPGVAVGVYTPEEVQDFDNGNVIDAEPVRETPKASSFKNATLRKTFCENVIKAFKSCSNEASLKNAASQYTAEFKAMEESGNEHDLLAVEELRKQYRIRAADLKPGDEIQGRAVPVEDGGLTPEEIALDQQMNGHLQEMQY